MRSLVDVPGSYPAVMVPRCFAVMHAPHEESAVIQRMSHVTVFVTDQDEALAFYRDKLGFEVRSDMTVDNGFRWLSVAPPGEALATDDSGNWFSLTERKD